MFKYIARGELLIICGEKYREPMANMFYSKWEEVQRSGFNKGGY